MTGVAPGGPVTVLVVEDDGATRSFMAAALRTGGYTVLEAEGSDAADRMASRFHVPVKLLVCDFVLPDGNGHEVAERMRERFPDIRVLLVSAHSAEPPVQDALLEEAFKKGAAFLQKPFGIDDLLRKVQAVMRG